MTVRCDRCGASTEIPESFVRQRKSFRRSIGTWCPRCWTESQLSLYKWVFLLNFVLGGAGLALLWLTPGDPEAWLFLNLFLVQVFIAATILPHELGHAFAGRLLGFRVFGLYVGAGPRLFRARVFGLDTEFRAIPTGGLTLAAPRETRLLRPRRFLMTLAGPFVNLLLMASVWRFIHFDGLESLRWLEKGPRPGLGFFYANLYVLAVNLWPSEVLTPLGKVSSDGKALWKSVFMKRAAIDELHAAFFTSEGIIEHQKLQYGRAREWFEHGLRLYPDNFGLLNWLGIVLIDLQEYAQARE